MLVPAGEGPHEAPEIASRKKSQLEVAVSADPKAKPPPVLRLELESTDAVPIMHVVPPPTSAAPACSSYLLLDATGGTLWLGETGVQFGLGPQGPRHAGGYVSGRDGVWRSKLLVVLAADMAAEVTLANHHQLAVNFRKPSGAEVERQQATYALLDAEGKTNYTTLLAQMKRGRHRGVEAALLERAASKLKTLKPKV